MHLSKRTWMGLFLSIVLIVSIGGTMSFAKDSGRSGSRAAGDLYYTITGNVLYTPILLDFESDGKIEIIVGSHDTIRCLEDPDGDGTWSERWSNRIGSSIHNSPNIADLEGDGEVEVLMISESANSLFAIDDNGDTKWQFDYSAVGGYRDCHSAVASADLNFDGTLETLFSPQSSGEMLVVDDKGAEDVIGGGSVSSGGWHSSPAIGELDGDDTSLEYIHQGAGGTIYALRLGGAKLWEKSLFSGTTTNPSPAIGDLDQDGDNEVIVVSEESNTLYCLEGKTGNVIWSFPMSAPSMSSPALADLDVDELWEVIIGDTSGNLYAIDHTGEEVWKVNLGAPIKPSPAIADLDSDGLLEVVEVSNDGKAWAVDEDGTVMWSYATHESIPTSSVTADPSPVIGDVDSDGYLEVLFATGSGTLRALETDGQVPSSALPWPMFRYDREHTGFYNGTLEYGASLKVDEEHTPPSLQSPLIHFIEPGATTLYNLTLTNVGHQSVIVGMFRDRFTLTVDNVPANWSASLTAKHVPINEEETVHHDPHFEDFIEVQKIEHIQLNELGELDFTMSVTAPKANVSFGDFAAIDAFAMSEGDNNATDSITTTTFLDIVVDVSVDISADLDPFLEKKYSDIAAGADKMLQVEVTNTGNVNDTYDLDIRSGIPSGWTVSLSPDDPTDHEAEDISLPSPLFGVEQSRTSFPLFVHCPLSARKDDRVEITLAATSRVSEESKIETVVRKDSVIMVVKETNLLDLEVMKHTKKVDPKTSVTYTVVVTNRGNSRAEVDLTVTNPQKNIDISEKDRWKVYWEASHTVKHTVTLRQHEPVPLGLVVGCPENAIAGTRIVMDIRGEDTDDPSVVASTEITAIVNEKYEYTVNFSRTTNNVLPGKALRYKVNIDENNDGVPEKILVGGKMKMYNFTIKNTGNAQDEIFLYLKNLPTVYWGGRFEENGVQVSTIVLGRGEELRLTLVILIPEDALAGLYDLGVTFLGKGDEVGGSVKPENDPRYQTVKMTVLEVHDITLKRFDIDERLEKDARGRYVDPGAHTFFAFKVTNNGNCKDFFKITANGFPTMWQVWFSSIANRRSASLTENKVKFDFREPIRMIEGNVVNYLNTNRTSSATVELDVGGSVWVTLNLQIPRTQSSGTIPLNVNATAWDPDDGGAEYERDLSDNRQSLKLFVANADLYIIGTPGHAKAMKEGETYSISARIGNDGDIQGENVQVTLKVDGEIVDTIWIQLIGIGQEKVVSFAWTAAEGEHDITIDVDPSDSIVEKNDHKRGVNNNEAELRVVVEGKGMTFLGVSAISWGMFFLIVLLGVGGILGIATGVYKSRLK